MTDGTGFRTIMAYSCSGGTRINYVSNPNKYYVTSGGSFAMGDATYADNARTLRENMPYFAGWLASNAPTNLATSNANGGIQLTWTSNSPDATSYIVERTPSGSATWATIGTSSTTTYLDTAITVPAG